MTHVSKGMVSVGAMFRRLSGGYVERLFKICKPLPSATSPCRIEHVIFPSRLEKQFDRQRKGAHALYYTQDMTIKRFMGRFLR